MDEHIWKIIKREMISTMNYPADIPDICSLINFIRSCTSPGTSEREQWIIRWWDWSEAAYDQTKEKKWYASFQFAYNLYINSLL